MMKVQKWLVAAAVAAAMCAGSAMAQQDNGGGAPGGGPGGRFGRGGNFDPAQMRQRFLDRYKEVLEVASDDDWKAMSPLVQKVVDARMQSFGGMGRGLFGPRRSDQGGDQNGQRRGGMFGQAMPEADALQKAIDAKAPKAEIKAALDRYIAARKAKQTELEKAQDDLRKVLTARQEAIASLNGLL
jgi:hypothetical protein